MRRLPGILPLVLVAACGSHGSSTTVDAARSVTDARADQGRGDSGRVDARRASDAAPKGDAALDVAAPDGGPCHAAAAPADRTRKIVVSHPFDNNQGASSDFEVFDLSTAGVISEPKVHFALGPTTQGRIAMTPDGAVGIVAEDDGTLGVFRFDPTGAPVVVHASLAGSYYATSVVMDPSGARAYVLDDQTENNGGGIYTVAIACDGTLTDEGLLAAAQLPATIVPVAGGQAVVAAKSFLGVPRIPDGGVSLDAAVDASADGPPARSDSGGNDAVLVAWPAAQTVLATVNAFGDDLAIVSDATLTADGHYVLLGDNSQFSGVPNRVAVVAVSAAGLASAGVVANVNDPEALVASPFDDTVLVTSAFGNALFVLASGDGGAPFALRGPLAYTAAAPELPGPAVLIRVGSLEGRVLVAENQAIRQVQFAKGGVVTDLGPTATGSGNDFASLVGAIGVQP